MLFNSKEFIFIFLPIVWLTFTYLIGKNKSLALLWLTISSLFFYAWWSFSDLPILLFSILMNYGFGQFINSPTSDNKKKTVFYLSIGFNLVLLSYFKYTNFFVSNLNEIASAIGIHEINKLEIALPIGVSFFTFTQIAYLVDSYIGKVKERNFLHYVLFVTYFPHLIAGPVLHHAQMMPQFSTLQKKDVIGKNIAIGLQVFIIGLMKKIILADSLAQFANPVFDGADHGQIITFFDGWFGLLSYTFQIYFDFSGYTDMAIGLSMLFGISLPKNFDSPYKSTSIIDFWRRWHISLSTFLRDYLYIPLGGNRFGEARRYLNLLATMVLGGLWHGASWNFVLWGLMHGLLLVINHVYKKIFPATNISTTYRLAAWFITFMAVNLAWVLFRANTLSGAAHIYQGLFGFNGFLLPEQVVSFLHLNRSIFSSIGTMQLLGAGTIMGIFEQFSLLFASLLICSLFKSTITLSERARLIPIVVFSGFIWQQIFFGDAKQSFIYFQF